MSGGIGWALVFWAGVGLLAFTYAGYPMLLAVMARGRRQVPAGDESPSVSVVLVGRNESARVQARIANLLDGAPESLREIIVVCDGCTDDTAERAASVDDVRVKVLKLEPGQGKPSGVNAGVAAATGDVVVLCDARQRFEPTTLRRLVRWFSDPTTGAVSGSLEIERSESGAGQGVDAYWKLEKAIRQWESDLDSSVGCTGAVYAIRRDSFEPLPADTILDDVVVPMRIAAKGLRIRFDSSALAYDPQTLGGDRETRRKVRTLAGNFQMLARYPFWLLPWSHRLWWKLSVHKYLRLAGPVLMLLVLIASGMLRASTFYFLALVAQLALYGAAVAGMAAPKIKTKVLSIPAGFVFLQCCVVLGFVSWLRSDSKGGWK